MLYGAFFNARGDEMSDILYDAAAQYQKLKDTTYKIILGKKGKSYRLMLHFPSESFFHLAGLQHLTDITFSSKNKERIFKDILAGKITEETIKKSVFYEKEFVNERLQYLDLLQTMLESNSVVFRINPKDYARYTKIKANYLFTYTHLDIHELYFFSFIETRNPRFEDECKGCSFFKKHEVDFTQGTSKSTTLLINKILNYRKKEETTIEIYRNPSYEEVTGNNL